jgi:xanthine dehydrogenase accessory factor
VEPTVLPGTVYLFGAGHVSRPVAELASVVDFQTVVLDDRAEFSNAERFPKADQIKVIPSFHQAFEGLDIDRDSYVVILTRGHLHDKTVLEQALKSNAGYIGMIGSRRKRDLIYQELLGKGFAKNELERVCAPIGLAIGAETPEEIAVSIVAELIQVRAGRG